MVGVRSMVDPIPWAKLDEGIRLIFANLQQLIESATLLYRNKKFLYAASFAIFAFEETSKAELLIEKHRKGEELSIAEWEKLTKGHLAHKDKLLKFLEREKIVFLNLPPGLKYSEQDAREDIERHYRRIKNRVFYVDWIHHEKGLQEPMWQWLPEEYSEDIQHAIALKFLSDAKRRFADLKKKSQT